MLKFALFGAGRIGVMHAANIAANPQAELAWVFDVNKQAAEAVAAKHGAKVAASVEAGPWRIKPSMPCSSPRRPTRMCR